MDLGLKGKTAIVTGGGSNIGRAISLTLAAEGCNVVIADIDEPQAQKVIEQCIGSGGNGIMVKTDVSDWEQVRAMVKKAIDTFGQVDVLVKNVGWIRDRLFIEKPREEWEKEIKLNFWPPINCIRAVLDHMIERRYGHIVSIASDAGRMGEFREAVYGGCKAGVIALTKSVAREVGRYGINLNVVCPGLTVPTEEETGQGSMWSKSTPDSMGTLFTPEMLEKAARAYPLRRLGTAQDMASAVVFLASDAASYITGQTLSVSGGYTMM